MRAGGCRACTGRLVRVHLIPRQLLKREGHGALVPDERTWVLGAAGRRARRGIMGCSTGADDPAAARRDPAAARGARGRARADVVASTGSTARQSARGGGGTSSATRSTTRASGSGSGCARRGGASSRAGPTAGACVPLGGALVAAERTQPLPGMVDLPPRSLRLRAPVWGSIRARCVISVGIVVPRAVRRSVSVGHGVAAVEAHAHSAAGWYAASCG
jgi:hypothetical protein